MNLFPDDAIAILRRTRWNPLATCNYCGFSGGLFWSDEFPRKAIAVCIRQDNYAHRYVIAYRASLICGHPTDAFRPVWDQLARECPRWPGFRRGRGSRKLQLRLEAESARFLAEVEAAIDRDKEVS